MSRRILVLMVQPITQEEAQIYSRGSQCEVSVRECALPVHTVPSPDSGKAFGSGLRQPYSSQRLHADQSMGI